MPQHLCTPTQEQKTLFHSQKEFLRGLCDRINAEHCFNFFDWEILFYTLENYQPDFIFEMGRGEGNSTSVILSYCLRHPNTSFLSIDIFDTWEKEVIPRLPKNAPPIFFECNFPIIDFSDFDVTEITNTKWNKLFVFWDINDEAVADKMVNEFLPEIAERNVLICMHDVSAFTGRPKRFRWKEFESLHADLEIVGRFLDKQKWSYDMPDTRKIFGHYENAGHWLLFSPVPKH